MGRPKKITQSNTQRVAIINFDKQVEGVAVTKKSGYNWVKWGVNNTYPLQLLNLYANSPTHAACVNFEVQSLVGGGVDYDKMKVDGSQIQPNYYQTWDEILRSISLDYSLYGSYALEIIKNKDNKTFSYYHIPLEKVRWSEYDEDGQITSYWLCKDWTALGKYTPVEVRAFDMLEDADTIERGVPYLYVYRPYSPLNDYYTSPKYISAIKAIQSEIEYVNFDLKSTSNSFIPAGLLTLSNVETDEERQGIIDNIQKLFTGTDNANSLMISFVDNIEQSKPSFTPFSTSTGNINLFDSANQRNIIRILAGHQIPNASLVGIPDIGQTGFASEADKLETAYNLYNQLTGNHNRNAIVGSINLMLKMNGIDTEIILKPISYLGAEQQVSTQQPETEEQDNVEEQVTE